MGNNDIARASVFLMVSFSLNLVSGKRLGTMLMAMGMILGGSPSLAQLPELPPAPPAPPASPPVTAPAPPVVDEEPMPSAPESEELEDPNEPQTGFIRTQASCPQDFAVLSSLLIRDIPGYTNRILQSSVADIPTAYRPAYVITASLPERMPLDIRDRVYTTLPDSSDDVYQLFFTTLERQYSGLDDISIEHFHWLFLVPDEQGWRMVFMFSAIEAGDRAQIPPRDSSQGSVGQAVQRWLRDCRAEAIFVE